MNNHKPLYPVYLIMFVVAITTIEMNFKISEKITFNGELKLSDLFIILLTFILAYIAYLTYKLNDRHVWLTGAMETHSDLMLQLRADELEIPIIKWNPHLEKIENKVEHRSVHVLRMIMSNIDKDKRGKGSKESAPKSKKLDQLDIYSKYYQDRLARDDYRQGVKDTVAEFMKKVKEEDNEGNEG